MCDCKYYTREWVLLLHQRITPLYICMYTYARMYIYMHDSFMSFRENSSLWDRHFFRYTHIHTSRVHTSALCFLMADELLSRLVGKTNVTFRARALFADTFLNWRGGIISHGKSWLKVNSHWRCCSFSLTTYFIVRTVLVCIWVSWCFSGHDLSTKQIMHIHIQVTMCIEEHHVCVYMCAHWMTRRVVACVVWWILT